MSPKNPTGPGSSEALSVAVLYGGPSPEHDVSILTGLQAARELTRTRSDVIGVYWSPNGTFHRLAANLEAADFLDGVPKRAEELGLVAGHGGGFVSGGSRLGKGRVVPLDVVVNCCHGGPGEDGSLQAALDLAGVRYTGPSVSGAALGMDKLAFAGVVAAAGMPVLPRSLLDPYTRELPFAAPYILKPRFGGSSLGVEVVTDLDTALARLDVNVHLRAGAVIEPFRDDLFDLNIAVRSWPQVAVSAIERPLRSESSKEILEYSDKYVGAEGMASAPRELPAVLPDALAKSIRDDTFELARLCEVRGVARMDFLSDGESLFVNEVNTIPGSLARYLWVDPKVSFAELLEAMIEEAVERPTVLRSSAGADGSVLRQAGNIASKLT